MTDQLKPENPTDEDELCAFAPIGLLAELTHRCPLKCAYCSNPVELKKRSSELTTEEWADVMKQAGEMGILQLHLSGGEPAARKDLEAITKAAVDAGLYTNLITSGVTLTKERLKGLANLGLDHVQLSIQHLDPQKADLIAGYKGGVDKKHEFAGWVRTLDLPLTLNAPMHRLNVENLKEIIDYAVALDAERLEVAHVQYYGWAFENRAALIPTRQQVIDNEDIVLEARERLKGILSIDFVVPDYYAAKPKPCMGGWGRQFITINPIGDVLPCHAAQTIDGLEFENVKTHKLRDIWMNSSAFLKYRGTDWMAEPCRSCEFKEVDWGGCRCQAFAFTGDAGNVDPACNKSSFHSQLRALAESEADGKQYEFDYRRYKKEAEPA